PTATAAQGGELAPDDRLELADAETDEAAGAEGEDALARADHPAQEGGLLVRAHGDARRDDDRVDRRRPDLASDLVDEVVERLVIARRDADAANVVVRAPPEELADPDGG